jgi:hypothetical protein
MNFKRGDYYIYEGVLLRYNSQCKEYFSCALKFYDVEKKSILYIPLECDSLITHATKLDLLLRGLDENFRIPSRKTASTRKRRKT